LNCVTVAHSSSPSCNRRLQPSSLDAQSPLAAPSSSSLCHNRIYRSHLCRSLAQLSPAAVATPRWTLLLAGPCCSHFLFLTRPIACRNPLSFLVVNIFGKKEHNHYLFFNCCLICCRSCFRSRYLPL
ncbi:hypothetical protein GW17_00033614, partial [Ensete ventricosum]